MTKQRIDDHPVYTEEEYARVALAADTAEHERDGLVLVNMEQARTIERLKKALDGMNKVFFHIDGQRQHWKDLRHQALEDIQHWKRETAIRMCDNAISRLNTKAPVLHADDTQAMEILLRAKNNAEISGRI